jgi:tetratricopeptide (TPR) repeat protein
MVTRGPGLKEVLLFITLGLGLSLAAPSASQCDRARELYDRTEYHQSLNLLNGLSQKDAEAFQLAGQDWFMLGEYKKATEVFEKAAQLDPNNSEIYHWLGRTYGRRAETGSVLTAPGNASKARQFFERSVELDPKNQEAINDLFDYYLEAPGFLGGGLNKAEAVAGRIGTLNPAEGHYAEAQIKDKLKEYSAAETHLRMAAELSPHQVGRVLDVAKYLSKLHKFVESEMMFDKASKMAPQEPKVLYSRAETYVKSNRNLDQARKLLEEYVHSSLTPDDPPREQALGLLKKIPN